jgi:AAA ATPase domain
MDLLSVRVKNFRSIVDSGWVPLSHDGVTVFVGQNESGKTSLLDAINCVVGTATLGANDLRVEESLPTVSIKISFTKSKGIQEFCKTVKPAHVALLEEYIKNKDGKLFLEYTWVQNSNKYECYVELLEKELEIELSDYVGNSSQKNTSEKSDDETTEDEKTETEPQKTEVEELSDLDLHDLAIKIDSELPRAVLFKAETGLLPNQIDITDAGELVGEGAAAAANFLTVAGIDAKELLSSERRARETILQRANEKISANFNTFWSQLIGEARKLKLECDYDIHGVNQSDKVGKPHLVFWICDGSTRLYPKQRSQGVRWFISFYLQLKASESNQKRRIFLLDEPGANLHSKAQADVLRLINQLRDETTVVYTTHSPHLIEYDKLYRVHAVQRVNGDDESPTIVIDAHKLGTASNDTLSPVLTAMGADFNQQEVVKKTNNVLLEEMSGYYYLKAFWQLTGTEKIAHFIATSGVNKIEAIASMFRGWGLDFAVALDDDTQGRGVYNNLKRDLFGDDENEAKKKLYKIKECNGIEDVFSREDFKKFVLKEPETNYTKSNTEFLKTAKRSKPVMAYHFLLEVKNDAIKWDDLQEETQQKIKEIVEEISSRLADA